MKKLVTIFCLTALLTFVFVGTSTQTFAYSQHSGKQFIRVCGAASEDQQGNRGTGARSSQAQSGKRCDCCHQCHARHDYQYRYVTCLRPVSLVVRCSWVRRRGVRLPDITRRTRSLLVTWTPWAGVKVRSLSSISGPLGAGP